MIGWALTDLVPDDPRVNPDGIVRQYEKWDDADAYLAWLKDTHPRTIEAQLVDVLLAKGSRLRSEMEPSACFVHYDDGDGGLGNVLCVRPLGSPDWHRYGDLLDWVHETWLDGPGDGPGRPWVRKLPDAPFPYNGMWMDARTGASIKDSRSSSVLAHALARTDGTDLTDDALDKIAERVGFTSAAEARRFLAPDVPDDIRHLCEWGHAFTSPDVVLSMRPVAYCWWS